MGYVCSALFSAVYSTGGCLFVIAHLCSVLYKCHVERDRKFKSFCLACLSFEMNPIIIGMVVLKHCSAGRFMCNLYQNGDQCYTSKYQNLGCASVCVCMSVCLGEKGSVLTNTFCFVKL